MSSFMQGGYGKMAFYGFRRLGRWIARPVSLGGVAGTYRGVGEACVRIELREEMASPQPESFTVHTGRCKSCRSLRATGGHAMRRPLGVAPGG